jgi:8-oxo-dGTP pyrophosphatase MutT (NUDIX family)
MSDGRLKSGAAGRGDADGGWAALAARAGALFSRPLPGLAAQLEMAPTPRPGTQTYLDTRDIAVRAAVLILLYPKNDRPHIVFIRRPDTALHHRSQIAFPGGQIEAGEDAVRAALREAEEEVGAAPSRVRVLGELTPLYIPPSNFCIYPVLGAADGPMTFVPFPAEVAEILEVPLAHLLDPTVVRRETWPLERGPVLVPFYAFRGHSIWGATAMVLAEFLAAWRRTPD